MQQDNAVRVRWFTFDIPTLAMLVSTIVAGVAGYYNLRNELTEVVGQAARTELRVAVHENKLSDVPLLSQQVTILKEQVAETNKRLDRFAEQISSGLELMRQDINQLTIKQEITSDKIDRLITQQKAEMPQPRKLQ